MKPAPSVRTVAAVVVGVGGLAFVVLAWLLVPWGAGPDHLAAVDPRSVFSAAEIRRGEDYSSGARLIGWAATAISLVVAGLFGFTSMGARLLARAGHHWIRWTVIATFALTLVGRLATLPLALVNRERRLDAGLTRQDLGPWLVDLVRGLAVNGALTALGLVLLVWCARRWRDWWPAVAALGAAALVLIGSFLYPIVVEPVFNNFADMEDGALRTQILELADSEGVEVDEVLVADASRRTTTLNAYVSGFAGTRRVVVYDNLLMSTPDDQVLSVVAHELAHAKHDDVLVGTVLGATGAATGIGLLALLTSAGWVRRRSGTDGVGAAQAVPLVLALFAVGSLLASPIQSGISRQIETRADVVALETTQDPDAFVALQRELCLRSRCDPTPVAWAHWWFGTHPTVLDRVALARASTHDAGS